MKNLILVFFVLAVLVVHNVSDNSNSNRGPASESVDAWPQWKTKEGSYKFFFRYKGELLVIEKKTQSTEAYNQASLECFKHFNKVYVDEETGLDVIDVCANPRTK